MRKIWNGTAARDGALALAAALAAALPAHSGPAAGAEGEIERLAAWPELAREAREHVRFDVARLREARTPEMGEEARAALVAIGAAAAPLLLDSLGRERDEAARGRIRAVLEAVTGPAHTRLLAAEFAVREGAVRTWALERAARFPDSGTREAALAAWRAVLARAAKKGEKAEKEAADRELLAAALAVTASGATEALPHLFSRACAEWRRVGVAARTAAEAVRGEEATAFLLGRLGGERAEEIGALRLLAACGTREGAAPRVAPYLDAEDVVVRVAAINALRGIVDGAPPLEELSAFDAIEMAREWKSRLR
ncbi:MAG: hypothetical protein AB1726_06345 [Planctomycetota bacterium]